MKCFVTGLLATLAVAASPARAQEIAPPRCDYGAPHPNAPAALDQFSFLIGDFSISGHAWLGDQWSPPRPGPKSRWNGWYELGGMAIADEWYDTDPGFDPNSGRGLNVRTYDPDAGEWDMMWFHTSTLQVQDLRAEVIDGVLTMWQVYPERQNFRATFHIEDEDHWSRITYAKDEAGEWVKTVKLAATRIACEN